MKNRTIIWGVIGAVIVFVLWRKFSPQPIDNSQSPEGGKVTPSGSSGGSPLKSVQSALAKLLGGGGGGQSGSGAKAPTPGISATGTIPLDKVFAGIGSFFKSIYNGVASLFSSGGDFSTPNTLDLNTIEKGLQDSARQRLEETMQAQGQEGINFSPSYDKPPDYQRDYENDFSNSDYASYYDSGSSDFSDVPEGQFFDTYSLDPFTGFYGSDFAFEAPAANAGGGWNDSFGSSFGGFA